MNSIITEFSIYTIVHVDTIRQVQAGGGIGSFEENKAWKTGERLFHQAKMDGRRMPIVFADAATTANLICYAFLTHVEILESGGTRYTFENLTPVTQVIPKSTLIKRSDGKPLSDDFIRPYSIVYTPEFIHVPDETPTSPGLLSRLVDAIIPDRLKPQHATTPIYLFGYSGRTDEQIERAIGEDGLLIDIRFSPKTRRSGYSRAGLIRTFGERYHHIRELGNADYKTGGIRLSDPDTGLEQIDMLAADHNGPLFLMCACEDCQTCHRRTVGDLLRKRGYSVKEFDFNKSS